MIAAFFDIDGTLVRKPSLERRLIRHLLWRRKMPARNYLLWLAELMRLLPEGWRFAVQRNKAYLRGIRSTDVSGETTARARVSLVPKLFPDAVQRIWWHAMRGDRIVLVSGTLQPLAEMMKFALERELLWRGIDTNVSVLATRLEICDGRFTGQVVGEAMFGKEKAQAIRRFAERRQIALVQSSAYGDSGLDAAMLSAVGHPFAVNPTRNLKRIAADQGWQTLAWTYNPPYPADRKILASSLKLSPYKRKGEIGR